MVKIYPSLKFLALLTVLCFPGLSAAIKYACDDEITAAFTTSKHLEEQLQEQSSNSIAHGLSLNLIQVLNLEHMPHTGRANFIYAARDTSGKIEKELEKTKMEAIKTTQRQLHTQLDAAQECVGWW